MKPIIYSRLAIGCAAAALCFPAQAENAASPNQPPAHTKSWDDHLFPDDAEAVIEEYSGGKEVQRGTPVRAMVEQKDRLDRALGSLQPQRPGVIDAYVVSVALDSDPVFAREAREAGRVLSRRYGAAGRSIILAGPDGRQDDLPQGSPRSLNLALARVADLMDPSEDVLVFYSTSHGDTVGLIYHYGDSGFGILSPQRFKTVLEDLGIDRRLMIISACFSGVFVPALRSDNSAILTAAAANRSSFGCNAENDWTFYGDALINRALRKPQALANAAKEAKDTVSGWESGLGVRASRPQIAIGGAAKEWLAALEARMPQEESQPVGTPANAD